MTCLSSTHLFTLKLARPTFTPGLISLHRCVCMCILSVLCRCACSYSTFVLVWTVCTYIWMCVQAFTYCFCICDIHKCILYQIVFFYHCTGCFLGCFVWFSTFSLMRRLIRISYCNWALNLSLLIYLPHSLFLSDQSRGRWHEERSPRLASHL